MESIYTLFLYFVVCSFIGWVIESGIGTFLDKKFVNSGFLYGPFVPIYGFGCILAYFCSVYLSNLFFPLLLIIYFLIPSVIEYITSFLLEKIFHLRLWDYSNYEFNLNGRIWLGFSILWFMGILLAVFIIQPFTIEIIQQIPLNAKLIISGILFFYFIVDFIFSVKLFYRISDIRKKMKQEIKSKIISPAMVNLRQNLEKIKNSKSLILNLKKEMDSSIEKMRKNQKD